MTRWIPRLALLVMLAMLAGASGCRRARALGPPKAVAVAADGRLDLKLVSLNLRYENGDDAGHRAWPRRLPRIVRVLREEAADVMGVQEALHGQAADLWASLPDYEFLGRGRADGHRAGEYVGIYYRRDRFEADAADGGVFWLSDTPEQAGSKSWGNQIPRIAQWQRLVDRGTQRGFYVFNTHWDHRHQGARERSAELLARRINGRRHPQEPVVMLGDLNVIENNPALATLLREARLQDGFRSLHPQKPARTTLHFWRGVRAGALKVDYILASHDARFLSAEIRSHDFPLVSDHFPVTARIVFP